ncbi:Inositol-pentakisphosphate 2-kinase family protein [Cryptosporidium felis]|nr:Inositol-pentakisphosphate 2-kinase family protein [Cryptosporidium felis]
MNNFPTNWKFFGVDIEDVSWDFLADGGMHSVFSTASKRRLNLTRFPGVDQNLTEGRRNAILTVTEELEDKRFSIQKVSINRYILKIEKKDAKRFQDLTHKIHFEFSLKNTKLFKYANSPRTPLIFIQNSSFRLGWLEPNTSFIEVPTHSINACISHDDFSRQMKILEFKPKCPLPFLVDDFTLYGVLHKLVRDNSWLVLGLGGSLEEMEMEFGLILRYCKAKGHTKIQVPSQISIQNMSRNMDLESSYSPGDLFFSESKNKVFLEFLKVINISGKLIQANSVLALSNLDKSESSFKAIETMIPLFFESLSNFSQAFNTILFYQTFSSGQQLLAFYIFSALSFIIPQREIQNLMDASLSKGSSVTFQESSEHRFYSLEFYKRKALENFQIGLIFLTELIFQIDRNKIHKEDSNFRFLTSLDPELKSIIQESTNWLSNFFFGRSISDYSLIISLIITNKECKCPESCGFKLIRTPFSLPNINTKLLNNFQNNYHAWTRVKIIDLSSKPLEKIYFWKTQFIFLMKKLLIYEENK